MCTNKNYLFEFIREINILNWLLRSLFLIIIYLVDINIMFFNIGYEKKKKIV